MKRGVVSLSSLLSVTVCPGGERVPLGSAVPSRSAWPPASQRASALECRSAACRLKFPPLPLRSRVEPMPDSLSSSSASSSLCSFSCRTLGCVTFEPGRRDGEQSLAWVLLSRTTKAKESVNGRQENSRVTSAVHPWPASKGQRGYGGRSHGTVKDDEKLHEKKKKNSGGRRSPYCLGKYDLYVFCSP